jgi:hypothetical protein
MEPFSLGWVIKYDGKTLTHLIPMFSELPEDHPYYRKGASNYTPNKIYSSFRHFNEKSIGKSILRWISRPLLWFWNRRVDIIGALAIIIGGIGVLIQIHDLFCRK